MKNIFHPYKTERITKYYSLCLNELLSVFDYSKIMPSVIVYCSSEPDFAWIQIYEKSPTAQIQY